MPFVDDEPEVVTIKSMELSDGSIGAAPGTCSVSASFNINFANKFESIKINVGFSEAYSGIGDDTRENKYIELKNLVNEKFQDLIIEYAKNSKELSIELHKYFEHKKEK